MNANTNLTVVGIDIAKNVFQLHWTDPSTGEVIRKQLTRRSLLGTRTNKTGSRSKTDAGRRCKSIQSWQQK